MPTMIVDALGCCAAGLCARSMLSQHPEPQHAVADEVAPTDIGDTVEHTDQPVRALSLASLGLEECNGMEVAPTDIGVTVEHTDQPVSSQGTQLQALPSFASFATCCSNEAKEQVGQDVRQDAAEEDASSTIGSSCPGRHGDAGSADSESTWGTSPETTCRSPETTFAPATVSEQEEVAADVAAGHPAVEVEEPHLPRAEQACGSFKLVSDSTSSVPDQRGAPAAAEIAAAAAAAEPRDADAAAGQAAITQAALEETAEQAAAAESEPVSARIVGRSGKFFTIDMDAGDFAPSQSLTKRFREFAALDMEVRPRHPALPNLPQKSVFFRKNFKCGFMDDREQRLGAYLSALVADPAAVAEPSVRRFLGLAY